MKNRIAIGILIGVFICGFVLADVFAQGQFVRKMEIPVPETDLNNGGTGNMVSGVDLDNDGKTEIYLVNDNWNDGATEVIPRIYKIEQDGANWTVVWQAVAPVEKQNTWPTLVVGDLDKDGKKEVIWGPVNNFSGVTNLNPARVLVYEAKGDGSDVMGVDDGTGNYLPNSMWKIATEDSKNIRPMRWVVADPDNDGTDELVFADRTGKTGGGYYFGVASVSSIPDNGDGSETWTLEVSGLDFGLQAGTTQNKWDVAVIGGNVYTFCEIEISKLWWDGGAWQFDSLKPMKGGGSVQSAQVVDLDSDGVKEIICAVYDWGNDAYKGIYLLQEEADTLKRTELVNMSAYWPGGSRGPWGGASGDIDQDGKLDFVFGSRAATPNAAIFNLSYRGGDITAPASYTFAMIDSLYAEAGIWTVLNIANVDEDPELEVLYTSSTDAGVFPNLGTKPIVVLDYVPGEVLEFDNLVFAPEVLINGQPPAADYRFKPGRILDNGNTIWFCCEDFGNNGTYVFRSVDGGKTFTHNATPFAGLPAEVDAFDANTALAVTDNGKIWKTADGGVTWIEKYSYTISVIAPGFFDGLCVIDENVAIAVGDMEPNGNMHFVRTTDKGETWNLITGINFLGAANSYYRWGSGMCSVGQSVWVSATNTDYAASYVFRSFDAGVSWESFTIPTDVIATYPRSIAFSDNNNGLIADRRGNVVKSTDGGATWTVTNKPDTSADCWVNAVVAIPNTNIILGMDDIGVFYTTDLGATWGKINTPTEGLEGFYFMGGVFLNTDFGYAFAYSGSFGKVLRFEKQYIGISEPRVDNVPVDFRLSQNYPNPFNPSTTIVYSLPQSEYVTLKIYNLLGHEVKTLINGVENAGSHSVLWDGTDNFGSKVSSGIYIYSIRYNDKLMTKRMMLVK